MYEFIENLDKKEYEHFVYNNEKAHFMQSYNWGLVQKEKHFLPFYVGIKKNNKLIGTALLLEKKILKKYGYAYCPRGFITDYNDFETVDNFTREIKKFLKKHNDIFFRIDPDILLHNLDSDGNVLGEFNNFKLVNNLKNIGYIHKGFNKNFENNQPRYTFRLNIDKELSDIVKGFSATTRNIINRGNIFELEIYKDNECNIDDFYLTMMETAKRENIVQSNKEYYQNFYEILRKNNMSNLYTIKVDINKLKVKYKLLIEDNKKEMDICKNSGKIKDLQDKLVKLQKELNQIEEIKEEKIVLSSMITAKYKDKVWTVHGGNHSLLRWLNANYLLYYEIIKDANSEGYKIIDFFGTTGNPDPSNYIYGIHLFKKRLGGEYTEFIGEFDLVNKKVLYFLYNKYLKFKKKKKSH